MNRFSDQMLAKSLLESRERGVSLVRHVRYNATPYGIFVTYFGVTLAILAWVQLWLPLCFLLGMCVGSLLWDVGWLRGIRRSFPFTLKVTDWGKVESLANGEPG